MFDSAPCADESALFAQFTTFCSTPNFLPNHHAADNTMEGSVEGVTPDSLASFLSGQDEAGPTLVVDCRPFMAYNSGHVLDAVNVHCPPILKRRSGGFVALENIVVDQEKRERLQRGAYRNVVVYDQNTHDLQSADKESSLYSVLKSLGQQVSLERVFYLLGGYDAFSEECPLLCVTQQFCPLSTGLRLEPQCSNTADDDEQPVEILPHLLLGSEKHSSRREVLERLGVTALVNVSASCANCFPGCFRYLHIPAHDSASQDLAAWFPVANRFIDEVQAAGGRVLVHCQAGRSRSATVCLAYLIRTLHLSLDAAFEHVRARRQVIDPNLNFMRQLQDYSQRLESERLSGGAVAENVASSVLPSFGVSGSSAVSSGGIVAPPGAGVFPGNVPPSGSSSPVPSGSSVSSSGSSPVAGPRALPSPPQAPTEAAAPISLPSTASSHSGNPPPAYSAAEVPPPSPATASDVHCFFAFSSTELSFPMPGAMVPRTPEIPLPS